MDWTTLIQEIGGGLPAVVIAGLAYWNWSSQNRINALTDRAFEREREHSKEMLETLTAVRDVTQSIAKGDK